MSSPNVVPTSGWQVTGRTKTTVLSPTGPPVDGVEVTFRMADGTVDSVTVDDATFANPDRVYALIAAKVRAHDQIAGLSG